MEKIDSMKNNSGNGSNAMSFKYIIVLFFALSFFNSFSNAQNFFPSEIGNKYQIYYQYFHLDISGEYFVNEWRATTLSNASIINGNQYVRFSNGGPLVADYFFDQTAGLLFIKWVNDTVRLAINFNTSPGDSFISYFNGYPQYFVAKGDSIINFFGQEILTTKFVRNSFVQNSQQELTLIFAENIGLIGSYYDSYSSGPISITARDYKIRSAIIDSNSYGITTLQLDSISPLADRREDQFPFILTGNYSSNLNVPGYNPGYYLIDSFYTEIIQIRGSDTLGTFRYDFDNNLHANVSLLPQAGDKLLFRSFITDTTIFNNADIFPDTGYAVMMVLPPEPPAAGPDFFPLKHGNAYQYLYIWNQFPVPLWDSSFIRLDVVQGDTINGEEFFHLVTTGYEHLVTFNPNLQFRFDSLQQKLWVKLPGNPEVKLAVDYNAPYGSNYTSYITGTALNFTSRGIDTVIIAGEMHDYHSIEWHEWTGNDQSYDFGFTSDIGLTDWQHTSLPTGGGFYELVAAVINSTELSGPFSIDSITPGGNIKINNIPFLATTYYNMEHFNFVDSFNLSVEHYRDGMLLQSIVKNIPHPSAQSHSILTLNFPDRQIGDIIKLKAEASDTCMLHHHSAYPDTGWIFLTIVDSIADAEVLPHIAYNLEQNYPNPFNPTTTISYSVPNYSNVLIKIYNMLGQEITSLVNEEKPAGRYEVVWNAEGFTSGIYFYTINAESFFETRKMILLK